MHHLLIVDDDKNFADGLATKLKREGYKTSVVYDGDAALSKLQENKEDSNIDLVLLDINLGDPAFNGHQVCWEIKHLPQPPLVILLTAQDSVNQQKQGLEHADDYIPKAWHQDLWLARIRNRLKTLDDTRNTPGVIVVDERLHIDTDKQRAYKDGEMIRLTPLEYRLLIYLAKRRGKIVEREELFYENWKEDDRGNLPSIRTLDKHIATLRQKIEDDLNNPQYILTEHGVGYTFSKK